MTEQDKQLLLKDICVRMPHKQKVCYKIRNNSEEITETLSGCLLDYFKTGKIAIVKPYLRPMSSMTEEEEKELMVLTNNKFSFRFDKSKIINIPISKIDGEWHCGSLTSLVDSFDIIRLIDWLNAHHFDYRGLIERGLALEAPEGMYNI